MDVSLYTAMSAAKQFDLMQSIAANNIANANTEGFKADGASFKAIYLNGGGKGTNAYTELNSIGVSMKNGAINHTGRSNDVFVGDDNFFSVATQSGDTALSKSLTLQKDINGILVDSKGRPVISNSGGSITVGLQAFNVDRDGVVLGGVSGSEQLGKLKVITATALDISKDIDGNLVLGGEDTPPAIKGSANVLVGYLEESNVDSISEMTSLMSAQRNYELSTKMLTTVKGMLGASNKLIGE